MEFIYFGTPMVVVGAISSSLLSTAFTMKIHYF